MSTTELNKMVDGAYDRRVRELASQLADMVSAGEMTEIEANETLARKQDAWADSPWG
jgi:hypothetical protein